MNFNSFLIELQALPWTQVLFNSKAHQLGLLETKYSELVKYVPTNHRLLNHNGVLYR